MGSPGEMSRLGDSVLTAHVVGYPKAEGAATLAGNPFAVRNGPTRVDRVPDAAHVWGLGEVIPAAARPYQHVVCQVPEGA